MNNIKRFVFYYENDNGKARIAHKHDTLNTEDVKYILESIADILEQ